MFINRSGQRVRHVLTLGTLYTKEYSLPKLLGMCQTLASHLDTPHPLNLQTCCKKLYSVFVYSANRYLLHTY